MPLHLAIVRQASKKLVTRLKSGTTMRSIGRSFSRIPLSPFITVVQATGNVGSSVPFLQGISSVVATILQRAEAVKRNYEECEEIADLAKGVELAVNAAIGDAPEDELDEKTKEHIAELEEEMRKIVETMTHLRGKPAWRRFWRKDKHSNALAAHKQHLEHARSMFLVCSVLIIAPARATQRPPPDGEGYIRI